MNKVQAGAHFGAGLEARNGMDQGVEVSTLYEFKCYDRHGNIKWETAVHNVVVNEGLNDLLDKYFKGSTYTAAHYIGLKNAGTASAGDTMASHASWVENQSYSKGARQTATFGTVASQSVDNSASQASFDITTATSVAGAFLSTNSTKGGSTGTLYGAADFSAARSVSPGDTLNVKVTLTAASA